MSTAPVARQSQTRPISDQFAVEKRTLGGITLLTLHGTLDHAFEGRKVAGSIQTQIVVVNMRDVRRFASWGMSEWMDFLRINAERDLYFVECSTYAVSQINLVTGLLGHGKLVSFYSSYRCAGCGDELETVVVIPRDRATIRELPNGHEECPKCGGRALLEEYPASFFDTIADRPAFDIDDQVLAYFRTHFLYELPVDLTRFRAFRRTHKGATYLRLSGSISTLPSDVLANAVEGTTVIDLEHVVVEAADVGPWQAFMTAARAKVPSLQLLNCPPGFLERAVRTQDLHDRVKVRTFALLYDCARCNHTTHVTIDVAENLEQLVGGVAPTTQCPTCRSTLAVQLSPTQVSLLRSLPARDRDPGLEKFLAKARQEPVDKLENCLSAGAKKPTSPAPAGSRTLYFAVALTMLVVAGLGVVAFYLWQRDRSGSGPNPSTVGTPTPTPPPQPAFERPEWILTSVQSSAYCHDMINRLMCVGVSSYRATRNEAAAEADHAALEELVTTVGLKGTDPFFRENIVPLYNEVRASALSALQAADLDRASTEADEAVNKARKRVAAVLQASGGAAVPTQRTDWYWEEYAAKEGGTEVLVFVRYDVSLDAVKALVEKYNANVPVMDGVAVTAFPGLAWRDPEFTGGAMLTKVSTHFADAGIKVQDVVTAVGEHRVSDAPSFARRVEEWKQATPTPLKLTVQTGNSPARVVEVKR